MNTTAGEFHDRIQTLRKRIKDLMPGDEHGIKEEIKKLYIEIANTMRVLSESQKAIRELAQEFKQHKAHHSEVGRFYSFVKSTTSAELDLATLLDRAWNSIVMEDFDEAGKVLQQVLDIDPKNIRGLCFMGLTLVELEHYDEAMLYLQKVLIQDPDNPFARNNLGYICYKKGIWGEAIEHLVRALNQTKDRTSVLYANYYLGLVYYERSMLPDAIKFFSKAVQMGPNLQSAYYYLGLCNVKQYEFKKALQNFRKCLEIDEETRYGKLAAEELPKIEPVAEPDIMIHKKHEDDRKKDASE